mgnify:CR=1 FL=1
MKNAVDLDVYKYSETERKRIRKELGISDLEYKLYKNGRHEMLNEKNKDEVIQDLIEWINVKVKQYINS